MPTYSTIDLFVIGDRGDELGLVFSASYREKFGGWASWKPIGEMSLLNAIFPKTGLTAVIHEDHGEDAFFIGIDGKVYAAYWREGMPNWVGWSLLAEWPSDAPRNLEAKFGIATVQLGGGSIDLFITGTDGRVYTAYYRRSSGKWVGWGAIHTFPANYRAISKVAAVTSGPVSIDLFVVAEDETTGKRDVFATYYRNETDGWQPKSEWGELVIPATNLPSGMEFLATITAVSMAPGAIDIFTLYGNRKDTAGGVFQTIGTVASAYYRRHVGWSVWSIFDKYLERSGATGRVLAGSEITAVSKATNSIDLFVMGTDGNAYSKFWRNVETGWSAWATIGKLPIPVSAASFDANKVTAVTGISSSIDLFFITAEQLFYSAYFRLESEWTGWLPLISSDLKLLTLPPSSETRTYEPKGAIAAVAGTYSEESSFWDRLWAGVTGVLLAIVKLIETVFYAVLSIVDFILTVLGIQIEKKLRLGVVIQLDEGIPTTDESTVKLNIGFAASVFKDQANVRIISANDTDDDYIRLAKESSSDDTLVVGCDAKGWWEDIGVTGDKFRSLMTKYCGGEWRRLIGYGAPVCAFAVKRFSTAGDCGCSIGPSTDYATVNFSCDPQDSDLAHEMGHACNLWHEEDSSNLMHGSPTLLIINPSQRRELTRWQKALLRASRRVTFF